jgi:flagellar protein FliO/FliZ
LKSPAERRRMWLMAGGAGLLVLVLALLSVAAPGGGASENAVPAIRTSSGTVASPETPQQQAEPASGGSGGLSFSAGMIASLAWRLALVAVVLAGAVIGLRWWSRRAASPASTSGFVRVVDSLAISNGRSIHLVALGERVIAIGATTTTITMLDELTDEEAAQVLDPAARPAPQPIADFAAELFDTLRGARRSRGAAGKQEVVIGEGQA